MIYTCKNCKSKFEQKSELLKCVKCGKSICSECGVKNLVMYITMIAFIFVKIARR